LLPLIRSTKSRIGFPPVDQTTTFAEAPKGNL